MGGYHLMAARIFRTKWFTRFARKAAISDGDLRQAVSRAEAGMIDADLGAGVIKQRIARKNAGRSGGFRSILLFRSGRIVFFVYAFAKSDRDDIRSDELDGFRQLAASMLEYTDEDLALGLSEGAFF